MQTLSPISATFSRSGMPTNSKIRRAFRCGDIESVHVVISGAISRPIQRAVSSIGQFLPCSAERYSQCPSYLNVWTTLAYSKDRGTQSQYQYEVMADAHWIHGSMEQMRSLRSCRDSHEWYLGLATLFGARFSQFLPY